MDKGWGPRGSGDAFGLVRGLPGLRVCVCVHVRVLCVYQHALLVSLCLCMCVHLHLIAGDLIYPDTEIMFAFSFSQPCWSISKLALTAPVHQAGLVSPPRPPPSVLCRLAMPQMLAS